MDAFAPEESPMRWIAVTGLIAAAAAHLPVIAPHLHEAPYMGVLFVVLAAACVLLAATLISFDPPAVYLLAAVTCGLALLGYGLTRAVAFPQLADDVGNWWEPLGVVSVLAESVVLAASLIALRRGASHEPWCGDAAVAVRS